MASQGYSVNTQTTASAVSNATQNLIQALQYKGIRDPQLITSLQELITATEMYGGAVNQKDFVNTLRKVSNAIKTVGNNNRIQQDLANESTGTNAFYDFLGAINNMLKNFVTVGPNENEPYVSAVMSADEIEYIKDNLPASTGASMIGQLPAAIAQASIETIQNISDNIGNTMNNIASVLDALSPSTFIQVYKEAFFDPMLESPPASQSYGGRRHKKHSKKHSKKSKKHSKKSRKSRKSRRARK
jgi:hypothetical protein